MTDQDFASVRYPDAKLELWYDLYWVVVGGEKIGKGCDTIAEAWRGCADSVSAELYAHLITNQICW